MELLEGVNELTFEKHLEKGLAHSKQDVSDRWTGISTLTGVTQTLKGRAGLMPKEERYQGDFEWISPDYFPLHLLFKKFYLLQVCSFITQISAAQHSLSSI